MSKKSGLMNVIVKMAKRVIWVDIDPNCEVVEIKRIIASQEGVPVANQHLVCAGLVMGDKELVSNPKYELIDKTGVTMHIRKDFKISIDYRMEDEEKTMKVPVRSTTQIFAIKDFFKKKTEVPIEHQTLYLDGKVLENTKRLHDYRFDSGSRIRLTINASESKKTNEKRVFIKCSNQSILDIKFQPGENVYSLKKRIAARMGSGISKEVIELILGGELMENARKLGTYSGLLDGTTITLSPKSKLVSQQMSKPKVKSKLVSVSVVDSKNQTNMTIKVDYDNGTILEMKKRIADLSKRNVEDMMLVFAGRQLDDSKLIKSYDLRGQTAITLCMSEAKKPKMKKKKKIVVKGDRIKSGGVQMDLDGQMSVGDVKKMLSAQVMMQPGDQVLVHGDTLLSDMDLVEKYVVDGVVELVLTEKKKKKKKKVETPKLKRTTMGPAPKVPTQKGEGSPIPKSKGGKAKEKGDVTVEFAAGETHVFSLKKGYTALILKKMIAHTFGYKVVDMVLTTGGKRVKDSTVMLETNLTRVKLFLYVVEKKE